MPEKKSRKLIYILLGVIILAELLWTGWFFIFEKDGHHSDEIWSYGLSNSYYQTFIYQKADVMIDKAAKDDYINLHRWLDGSVLHDYVTVQEGERFSYGSVWTNQTFDHHPPLYYMLLHTVCSFFPDKFSWGFGFFLNCIFLIVTQIFLFKTARYIMKDDRLALITCGFYGFAHAALFTFSFIRQYSLLTMLSIMLIYFTARLYSERDLKKTLAPILIVSFLMFMTHYYGIVLAGALTACMCIYMLVTKQINRMLIYGFSMLGTLGLFFAVYPAALTQMFNYSEDNKVFPVIASIRKLINYITYNQLGFGISVYEWYGWRVIPVVLLAAVLLLIPLCFLFRKEKWFISVRSAAVKTPKRILNLLKKNNYIPVMVVVMSVALMAVVVRNTDIFWMGEASIRYLFCLFPGLCVAAVMLVRAVVLLLPKLRKYAVPAVGIIAAAAVIKINVSHSLFLSFENYPNDVDVRELTAGKNCLIILRQDMEWTLSCYPDVVLDAENVFVTTEGDFSSDVSGILEGSNKIDYILGVGIDLTVEDEQQLLGWGMDPNKDDDNSLTGFEIDENSSDKTARINQDDLDKVIGGRRRILEGCVNIINGYSYVFRLD